MLLNIRNQDGKIISSSSNLRGIRERVQKHLVARCSIGKIGTGEGVLRIEFENMDNFQAHFASYTVLCQFVRKWRSMYGIPLIVDGMECGVIGGDNPFLAGVY
jgi:hypothetical protein